MHYVLDTNVILSDPQALVRLEGRHLVIPLVVLNELESKRTHPELGYPAREALRRLEALRLEAGSLTDEIPTQAGGSLRVEVNHVSTSSLPEPFQNMDPDNRILAVAKNLQSEDRAVSILTNDLPLRLKASIVGIPAESYDANKKEDSNWDGKNVLNVPASTITKLYAVGEVEIAEIDDIPLNSGIILKGPGNESAIARKVSQDEIRIIKENNPYDIKAKNSDQSIALDLLCDPDVGIVSIGGKAGSGKTLLSVAAGLQAVKEKQYSKVIVFRPVMAVGDQNLGFLPGTEEEKMAPWAAAVWDAVDSFIKDGNVKRQLNLQVLPLTHIRGRTLSNTFVIVDEAQNLDLMTLVTAMSRIGYNSKIVLTHDINQRDNTRVGKYDGIQKVISKLMDNKLFGHIYLKKSERSAIAELVSNSFDI